MEEFDFPFHSQRTSYPTSGVQVQFGRSWVFAAEPESPDQRIFTLKFPALKYYVTEDGGIDYWNDLQMNAAVLDAFYQRHKLYKSFIYNHPIYGQVAVRFMDPLDLTSGLAGGGGVIEGLEVKLIEQPGLLEQSAEAPTLISNPTISGNASIEGTMTSTTGVWSGTGPFFFSYKWEILSNDTVFEPNVFDSDVFDEGFADYGVGQILTLDATAGDRYVRCAVTCSNSVGSVTAYSDATFIVGVPTEPSVVTAPTISGTAAVGEVLTGTVGTWAGSEPMTFSYQWLRDGGAIAGATALTYTLTSSDANHAVALEVTATNPYGVATSVSTSVTAPLVVLVPVALSPPQIVGSSVVGSVLACDGGSWNTEVTLVYQWKRNGLNLTGATSSTYTLVSGDADNPITCRVTATNAAGSVDATSNSIDATNANVAPSNSVAPAITGTATLGSTLSCSTGTWAGTTPITYTYQWKRNGSNLTGATSNTYVVVSGDVGQSITCRVTATNAASAVDATSNTVSPTSPSTTPTLGTPTVFTQNSQSDYASHSFNHVCQSGKLLVLVVVRSNGSQVLNLTAKYNNVSMTRDVQALVQGVGRLTIAAFTLTGITPSATARPVEVLYSNSSGRDPVILAIDTTNGGSPLLSSASNGVSVKLATVGSTITRTITPTNANSRLVALPAFANGAADPVTLSSGWTKVNDYATGTYTAETVASLFHRVAGGTTQQSITATSAIADDDHAMLLLELPPGA